MLDNVKDKLFMKKADLLFIYNYEKGNIVPFEDEIYDKLKSTYMTSIPVYIDIKYLCPEKGPGKCMDRSLALFFSLDNALLVRGNLRNLQVLYKNEGYHGWIELGDYVYDPGTLLKYPKDLYYKLHEPSNVHKCSIDEYCEEDTRLAFYNKVKSTTINDFLPGGSKRFELLVSIPLIKGIADMSGNREFVKDIEEYMASVQYDYDSIYGELDKAMMNSFVKYK